MKYILSLFALLYSISCFSQQITYKQWQDEAKTETRLLPKYGNMPKNKAQLKADNELIKSEVKHYGTHRKASDTLISLGFNKFYHGDMRQAMYRFNQAWLVDPKNENVYWGFGAIYFGFKDIPEALKQYNKGLVLNANNTNILNDKATIFMSAFEDKGSLDDLNKAIVLFNKSYKINPLNQNTLFKLSVAYLLKRDCSNAWRFYNECKKLGGRPIIPNYLNSLKKMCSN